jgi:hypothetical protein
VRISRAKRAAVGVAVALSGGVAVTASTPARADVPRVRVSSHRDATIRNGPAGTGSGYVIGVAKTARGHHRGVAFDLAGPQRHGYRYGLIHGNFNLCAWLDGKVTTDPAGTAHDPHCPGGAAGRVLPVRRFMYVKNGKPLRNCEPGHCNDGSKAAVQPARCAAQYQGGVPAYGNVLPWRSLAVPHDRYATIKAHSYRVYWRYVSHDGNWVMVHDHHAFGSPARRHAGFDHQAAKWFFVPRACVAGLPS